MQLRLFVDDCLLYRIFSRIGKEDIASSSPNQLFEWTPETQI